MSRACLAAAAVAFVAAATPIGAFAQTTDTGGSGSKPRVFTSGADALAVDLFPDQNGGVTPIKDTFHMQFVSGSSTMSSSNGPSARASVVDPGNGITKGPATACGQAGALADAFPDFAPILKTCTTATWPFLVDADEFNSDPKTAGALTFGSPTGQLDGEGGSGSAHIGDDGTSSTDAAMGGMRVAPIAGGGSTGLPLPPSIVPQPKTPAVDTAVFAVGSIKAVTTNSFDGGAVVAHSESVLNGVRFLGGLITMDSITSIADTRFESGKDPVGSSSTTVQGLKVGGQGATIDDQGLHTASSALDDAITNAGISMKLVGASQGIDKRGFMSAQSGGVVVDFTKPINTGGTGSGTYFVRVNLASVAAKSLARGPASSSTGSIGGSTSASSFASSTPSPATKPSGFTGGTATAPPPAPGAGTDDGSTAGGPVAFLGLDPGKVKLLYLAFTLAALGLCLVPRLALPARLPGPGAD